MIGAVSDIKVPWNAAWTGEARFDIRRCRFAQGQLAIWQAHEPGAGAPIFAEPHLVRQRRSIAEWRCTVCGDRTCQDDRWWFEHGHFNDGWYMTNEAPVHRACADHALKVCPHLRKRGVEPSRFPDGARMMAAMVKPEAIPLLFGIAAPASGATVIGSLKLGWPEKMIAFRKDAA